MKIDAPEFDREIKVRDAYLAMERFLQAHLSRDEASTLDLLSYACIAADGVSGDPAALRDFLEAVDSIKPEPIRDFQIIIEDDLSTASQAAVEVRVILADKGSSWIWLQAGRKRWTPVPRLSRMELSKLPFTLTRRTRCPT